MAIHRTRLQEYHETKDIGRTDAPNALLKRVLQPKLEALLASLDDLSVIADQESLSRAQKAIALAKEMEAQVSLMAEEFGERTAKKISQEDLHYPTSPLTNRELEVLVLVKKGNTNKEIATHLFITERTVKFHISAILSKLYAKTRTEAVDTALRRGLLGV